MRTVMDQVREEMEQIQGKIDSLKLERDQARRRADALERELNQARDEIKKMAPTHAKVLRASISRFALRN